jgi:hypothetical protein
LPLLADRRGACTNGLELLDRSGVMNAEIALYPLKPGRLYRIRGLRMWTLSSKKPAMPVSRMLEIRHRLLERGVLSRVSHDRVLFVTRPDSGMRTIVGQMQLLEGPGADMDVVRPESATLTQALEAFSSHLDIILPIGSAKFNLLFCRPGTRVACLVPRGYGRAGGGIIVAIRHICAALELRLVIVECPSEPSSGERSHMLLHHHLHVTPQVLAAARDAMRAMA